MCWRLSPVLLLLLWLTTAAAAQVSRSTQVIAPRAAPIIVSTSLGTAALPPLNQMGLPAGTKAFVETSVPSSLTDGPASGLLYQREQRDGSAVLVETQYEPVKGTFGVAKLKATGEWLYPGDTRLVYTGPWVKGTYGFGLKKVTYEGFAAYILRPLDVPGRRVTPRVGITSTATVTAGTAAPPKSGSPTKAPVMALTKPQPVGQDCGVKFNPEATEANQLHGLVCLLFTQEGQGITLPDGTKLFRRYGAIEHWKGDAVIQSTYVVVVRDSHGRYWFLESKGWL